jgi:hypothetical protein
MCIIYHWIKTQVVKLNLFESEASHSNAFNLRTAIISTRVYLLLLTLTITILITFTSLQGQTISVTIKNPSQTMYENLYNKYSSRVQCPCSKITIPYSSFVSISVQYHPVCLSSFVSDEWINLLFNPNMSYFFPLDFRSSASGQFQILASLCSLAMTSVHDAIDGFLSDTLLTPQAISRLSVDEQSQADSLFVQISTKNAFQRLLRLVRSTTEINGLQTALQTSRSYILAIDDMDAPLIYGSIAIFSTGVGEYCFCTFHYTCILPSSFYPDNFYGYPTEATYSLYYPQLAKVTGFVVGCYAIESLLQSTLECFFNTTCLHTILTFFPLPINSTFVVLNLNQTHFDPQTPIETLVNNLFIERWSTVNSFSSYYAQCAPISCTYTFTQRNNALYVLTKLLGLYGGIVVVLRFIVPYLIAWWRNRILRRANLMQPNLRKC